MYMYNRGQLKDYFSRCINTMRRRGPDAEGTWCNEKITLRCFTRLAIRDLSNKGNQPMQSDCGNYVISFNGEIYNTRALEDALEPFGQRYRSGL